MTLEIMQTALLGFLVMSQWVHMRASAGEAVMLLVGGGGVSLALLEYLRGMLS